jgi:hypothetical protein
MHKLAPILLLVGTVAALKSKLISSSSLRNEALVMAEQTGVDAASCRLPITKWKASQKNIPNYCSIGAGTVPYSDPLYPATDASLYWAKMPTSGQSRPVNGPWMRLLTKQPPRTLFGTQGWLNDVQQGGLGDCYFLAAAASVAEQDAYLQTMFVNNKKTVNKAGIWAINTWVRGLPSLCVIDDRVPGSTNPRFARPGTDGALWTILLEKCYAKTSGNYEYIGDGGWMTEAYTFLTGTPTKGYSAASLSDAALVTLFKSIDTQRFFATVAVSNANTVNLVPGHAYTFVSVCDIRKADNSVLSVLAIRNPWGSETYNARFSGSYADANAVWRTVGAGGRTYSTQCAQTNADDGLFYVTPAEFKALFASSVAVSEWYPNWKHNYYSRQSAAYGATDTYTMVNPTAQAAYIHFELYPSRMFPNGCATNKASYTIIIKKGTTQLVGRVTSGGGVILNATSTLLAAGTFTVSVKVGTTGSPYEVLDYTLKVYSQRGGITIKDAAGKTAEVGVRDDSGCASNPLSRLEKMSVEEDATIDQEEEDNNSDQDDDIIDEEELEETKD